MDYIYALTILCFALFFACMFIASKCKLYYDLYLIEKKFGEKVTKLAKEALDREEEWVKVFHLHNSIAQGVVAPPPNNTKH